MDDPLFDEPIEVSLALAQSRSRRRQVNLEKPDIEISDETRSVLEMLEDTSQNVFLTGRAGTGKSTLLNHFRTVTKKNIAVVAPTGVAAVNVHGETIHHFFKFGIGITPDQVRRAGKERAKVLGSLDMLVIDEISMVRADLFDCVDRALRLNGPQPHLPFGGVQMLLIGDLYQLPPVVMAQERGFFDGSYYRSPYFFDAKSYAGGGFETVELTHVYRQSDKAFVDMLDAIRVAKATEAHLAGINSRLGGAPPADAFQVSLVPRNQMADTINGKHVEKLAGAGRTYEGSVSGDFREKDFPTAHRLHLKEGAQVMLLSNDQKKRWVNGDLAQVISLLPYKVRVRFEDGRETDVERYTWEKVNFVFDEDAGSVVAAAAGSFAQFPLRLAWAVTIHKGQGKTYDRVAIDFGSGMFAPGQAYVALSRCRSLEGLSLTSPLKKNHIFTDPRIDEFMAGRDEGYMVEYL